MNESTRDRLSELPNSVISHILWFIPMNDVVRTSILSKRWKNLWTTLPFLNFDNDVPSLDSDDEKFRIFVYRALFRWNGIRILKFKLNSCSQFEKDSIDSDMDSWLNFAQIKKVEELYLHMMIADFDVGTLFDTFSSMYWVPQCVFSCSLLKILSLKLCNLTKTRNVEWNQLESLTMIECFGVTEYVVNEILSGSPRLEVLNLSFVDRGENLNIRSRSLKELSICKYSYEDEGVSLVSELTIWTPNLVTLRIKGFPYSKCRLVDVSSLSHATIGFYGLVYWSPGGCDFDDGIDLGNDYVSPQDYFGDKFSQALQAIQHVESVSLFSCCLKVLRAMKDRCMHSSFPNVKSLKIGYCDGNYEQLLGLLGIFPQLARLVNQCKKEEYRQDYPEPVEIETSVPESFLMKLRTIKVTWHDDDSIFPVIEMLLRYASNLEKMVFKIRGTVPPNSVLLASNKLLNMPRSSPNCTIELLHDL